VDKAFGSGEGKMKSGVSKSLKVFPVLISKKTKCFSLAKSVD
jgi:hypothetical protein